MTDFEKFMARHGESPVQDIVERIERQEGIENATLTLKQRWNALMRDPQPGIHGHGNYPRGGNRAAQRGGALS